MPTWTMMITVTKDKHVLFGLGRVCQHHLYHVAQLIRLRRLQETEWQPPPAGEPGSWERAADYIADLLIFGDKAPRGPPSRDSVHLHVPFGGRVLRGDGYQLTGVLHIAAVAEHPLIGEQLSPVLTPIRSLAR